MLTVYVWKIIWVLGWIWASPYTDLKEKWIKTSYVFLNFLKGGLNHFIVTLWLKSLSVCPFVRLHFHFHFWLPLFLALVPAGAMLAASMPLLPPISATSSAPGVAVLLFPGSPPSWLVPTHLPSLSLSLSTGLPPCQQVVMLPFKDGYVLVFEGVHH